MAVKIDNKSVSEIFRLSMDDCICFEVSLILLINKINTFPISCILDFHDQRATVLPLDEDLL